MVANAPLIPGAAPGTMATQDAVPWISRFKLPHQFGPVGQKKLIFGLGCPRGRSSLGPVGFEILSCWV